MTVPYDPRLLTEMAEPPKSRWWRRRNWLGETRRVEMERRLTAVEASVRSAHDRINEFNDRVQNDSGNNPSAQ